MQKSTIIFFNGGEEDRIHLVATLPVFSGFDEKKVYKELWV